MLISTDSLLRRRDLVEAIGAALATKAAGHGYRKAAAAAGAPESTTRRWLRRFADMAEAIRVWFTVLAHDLDPLLAPILARPTAFGDAVEAIAVAARAATPSPGARRALGLCVEGQSGAADFQREMALGKRRLSSQPRCLCSLEVPGGPNG